MRWPSALLVTAVSAAASSSESVREVEKDPSVWVVLCTDRPDAGDLRDRLLADHLAHVEANFPRYRVAGPLFDPGGRMTRSLFIIEARDLADARAFMGRDPYVANGLYAQIEYRRFLPALGGWIGGKVWGKAPEGD